jgi:serine/threonine protein kinase
VLPDLVATKFVDVAAPAELPAETTQAVVAMLSPPRQPDEIGRLGPYRVLKVLGTGAMGVVFEAQDTELGRTVALKAMKPVAAADNEARQRFLREARAAAAINHDHVVTIYQVGQDRTIPYLAMQLLHGESLDARLKREGRLAMADVLRISREIAEGLAAAHERGLIHRDIKPANVWLETSEALVTATCRRSRVKIVDFGLARAVSEDTQLTRTGTILGTPAYMSPEQARAAEVDARSDLFNLGAVIYRMAAGQLPFRADDTTGMLLAVATDDPPPLLALNPEVPPPLAGLVNRLLAKHPDGRPASASATAEFLGRIECLLTAAPVQGSDQRHSVGGRRLGLRWAAAMAVAVLTFGGSWYGPDLLRLTTNKGLVFVRTSNGTAKVTIKREGQSVIERTSSPRIELPAGNYQVELADAKPGLELLTKQFTLPPGGRVDICVATQKKK